MKKLFIDLKKEIYQLWENNLELSNFTKLPEELIYKEREKENTIKFEVVSPIKKDPNRGMRLIKCNNDPINRGRLGHSKTFLNDVKKLKTYYW